MAKFERKVKCPEGVPDWILTYGDMMSLLLCFFIMLYAISVLDVPKLMSAVESLNTSFGYLGSAISLRPNPASSSRTRVGQTGRARRNDTISGGQPVAAPPGDQTQILSIRPERELVRNGTVNFPLNSDAITTEARQQLAPVAQTLRDSPYRICIEGIASDMESQSIYQDPTYLAYARAAAVRDALVGMGIKGKVFVLNAVAVPGTATGVRLYQLLNFPMTPEGTATPP